MEKKKLVYGVLLTSLALNLFFAGMLTVLLVVHKPERPFSPPDQFKMIEARELLTPESQKIVDGIWEEFRRDQRGNFKSIFRIRSQIRDILLADQFDPEAFEQALARMQEMGGDMRGNLEAVLGEIAVALPPEERKVYFAKVLEPPNRDDMRDPRRRRPPPER